MASVSLMKWDTQSACYGIIPHIYREHRNYSNKDIQLELSHLNKTYGCINGDEAKDNFRNRVQKLDKIHPPKRIKKDRKTCLGLFIPSPIDGMSAEQEALWANSAWIAIKEMFGENLICGVYHVDEIHKYIGVDGVEHASRAHLHALIVPWTNEYGVNMNSFYNRDLPNKIHRALNSKCIEMFGFPFTNGAKTKSKKTVEELKAKSNLIPKEMEI